jgi:hypothetical protein
LLTPEEIKNKLNIIKEKIIENGNSLDKEKQKYLK